METGALRAEGMGFDRIAARLKEERISTWTGPGVALNRIWTRPRPSIKT
jgi:hypothetical protein